MNDLKSRELTYGSHETVIKMEDSNSSSPDDTTSNHYLLDTLVVCYYDYVCNFAYHYTNNFMCSNCSTSVTSSAPLIEWIQRLIKNPKYVICEMKYN